MSSHTSDEPATPAAAAEREAATILIVDDEFSVRDSLEQWFLKDGHAVETASSGAEALKTVQRHPVDVALVDIKMPGMDGLELQKRLNEVDPELAVIIITAYGTVDTAVQALKAGAFDYVTKPVDPDELTRAVWRALDRRRLQHENRRLRDSVNGLTQPVRIIGESPAMRRVLKMIDSVAATDATVLIRGESGTGKEVVAQAIHARSARRWFPIVAVNCGALPDTLLESELFGHEKGAFTGALYRRKGKLEMADGGTLFLDEIGTIDPRTQVELLRVLETKELCRLGGHRTIRVDFRVICATNHDLEALVKEGRFREDLYFRVNVFTINLPPLRERREDIPLLAQHFVARYARQMNRPFGDIEPEAMDLLVRHTWPGNVRELANAIERALVVGTPPTVRTDDLPLAAAEPGSGAGGETLEDVERIHVRRMLEKAGWNVTRAAERLKIDRVTLYNKMRKYGLRRPTA